MVGADGIADFRPFLILLGKLHSEESVWKLRIVFRYLSYIVEKSSPLGCLWIEAEFRSHDGADVGHLP